MFQLKLPARTWNGMMGSLKVTPVITQYMSTRNWAIQLMDGMGPYMTLSVNTRKELPKDRIAIKDWSENMGAAEAALNAKLITGDPVDCEISGHVVIDIYKLHDDVLQQILTHYHEEEV